MPRFQGLVLSDSEAHHRLGSSSQVLPEIFTGYIPTIHFGDVSDLVPAPGPPRGWVGLHQSASGVGLVAQYKIQSATPGGLLITRLFLDGDNVGTEPMWLVGQNAFPNAAGNVFPMKMGHPQDPSPQWEMTFTYENIQPIARRFPNGLGLFDLKLWVPANSAIIFQYSVDAATRFACEAHDLVSIARSPRIG